MYRNYEMEALINILIKKGILNQDEFNKEMEKVQITEELRRLEKLNKYIKQ